MFIKNLQSFYLFLSSIVGSSYFQIVLSAFFGGLFAGLFSNYFEVRRRLSDKRREKYFLHRNTIVQIEHESLPVRVNISRDITSLTDSLENTNELNKRIVLRFFKLNLSPGLSLNLLNLDLINSYAEVYGQFETINNDIDYISQIISSIIEDKKNDKVDENLINQYFQFSDYLLTEIKIADQKSLELLAYCKSILSRDEDEILKKYLAKGGEVKYNLGKKTIKKISNRVSREETKPYKKNEVRPKFITPFLDLKRVIIQTPVQHL